MQINNKAIRSALIDGTNWKKTLAARIKNYNNTPHSSTKFTPNDLVNEKSTQGFLPNFKKAVDHRTQYLLARANDIKAKINMKYYFDQKKNTNHVEFKLNDPGIVKMERHSKFDPFFDPHPYRIEAINGSIVTAKRIDKTITRNSKFFKRINEQCYGNAMRRLNQPKPKPLAVYIAIKKRIQQQQHMDTNRPTPPPTPMHSMITRSRKTATNPSAIPPTTNLKPKPNNKKMTTRTAVRETEAQGATTSATTSRAATSETEAQEATTSATTTTDTPTNKVRSKTTPDTQAETFYDTTSSPPTASTNKTGKTLTLHIPESSDESVSGSQV